MGGGTIIDFADTEGYFHNNPTYDVVVALTCTDVYLLTVKRVLSSIFNLPCLLSNMSVEAFQQMLQDH